MRTKLTPIQCVCQGCGSTFGVKPHEYRRGRGKYCSVACRPDTPRDTTIKCARCGTSFHAKPSSTKFGRGKYCSRVCKDASGRRPSPPRQLPLPRVDELRHCATCGVIFAVPAHNKPTQRFCSIRCRQQGGVIDRVIGACAGCGKQMLMYPDRPKKFCSDACHLASYPPSEQAERSSAAAKGWAKAVKRRDGRTCQHCGRQGGRLHAHHIKPWATYPELRTELSNGITLCEQCHATMHGYSLAA